MDMNHETDRSDILGLVAAWGRALEAKDVDGLMAHYAPDAVIYDCVAWNVRMNPAELRAIWESCLPHFPAGLRSEHRDLDVTVGGDAALVHSLHHMIPDDPDHPAGQTWFRVTLGFRRIDGQWRTVHEHVSVPFDPMSGKVVNITDPDAALPPIGCAAGEPA
jgi:ketosteroid isomerase-like protein